MSKKRFVIEDQQHETLASSVEESISTLVDVRTGVKYLQVITCTPGDRGSVCDTVT